MTDIVERLLEASRSDAKASGVLLKDAADEIGRLRAEYKKMQAKLEQDQKFGEPEF